MRIRQYTHSTQDPGTEPYTTNKSNTGEEGMPKLPNILVLPDPITLRQGGDGPAVRVAGALARRPREAPRHRPRGGAWCPLRGVEHSDAAAARGRALRGRPEPREGLTEACESAWV